MKAAFGVVHDGVGVFPKETKQVPRREVISFVFTGTVGEVVKVGASEDVNDVEQSHPSFR